MTSNFHTYLGDLQFGVHRFLSGFESGTQKKTQNTTLPLPSLFPILGNGSKPLFVPEATLYKWNFVMVTVECQTNLRCWILKVVKEACKILEVMEVIWRSKRVQIVMAMAYSRNMGKNMVVCKEDSLSVENCDRKQSALVERPLFSPIQRIKMC